MCEQTHKIMELRAVSAVLRMPSWVKSPWLSVGGLVPRAGVVAEGRKWRVENVVAAQNGEAAMGLMDRVKEQAAMAAQRASQMTQEAAQQGKARMDQAQAKRRADAMFRDLGAAVYAERTGRGGTDTADKIERLVNALQQQEAEQGLGDIPNGSAPS